MSMPFSLFVLIFLPALLLGLVWYYISRRGWASVRMLAFLAACEISGLFGLMWNEIRESWVIYVYLYCIVLFCGGILALPKIAPKLLEKLKLKW